MVIYKVKPNTWFDEGTIAELLDDYRPALENSGLFCGYVNGKLKEEICGFDEFEIIEEGK